jgi:glycosyltransferase involved in cell wall biosynthesis
MTAVAVYHNIVWPRYKGAVFSALYVLAQRQGSALSFVQIAQTDGQRAALGGVDQRYHRYPYTLLFQGAYDDVPTWRLCWTLARHVLRNPAVAVVLPGYHRPEYWAMLAACMVRGKPRAVFCDSTRHEQPRTALKALLKRLFLRRCQAYLAYGQRSAEYLLENGAHAAGIQQPCQAAALPIGFQAEAALAHRVARRKAAPGPRFLYVGRLAPEKDLTTLLRAFHAFHALQSQARLVLVGDGPARLALRALAAELGIADSIEWPGPLDPSALSEQYAQALCLVLPSLREPWGLVVNEALHHGCPVIVSECCGCRPELVVDGVTGWAYAAGDSAALLGRMLQAAEGWGDATSVGAACQRHVSAYTPEAAARHILAGCAQLLAGAA